MRNTMMMLVMLIGMGVAFPAYSDQGCSTRVLAGKWVFATAIGHQALGGPFPPGKDITAIGTMNIDRNGVLEGTFDATVQDTFFLPGNSYTGSLVVLPDCTGTLTFITSQGTARTDSIVVVNGSELIGMSQDPANLWTYQARRLGFKTRR